MKSLGRIVRVVLWGILLSWLLALLRRWMLSAARRQEAGVRRSPKPGPVLLRRDPYCGTYVSPEVSFPLNQSGHIQHFCSAECCDRFLAQHRASA